MTNAPEAVMNAISEANETLTTRVGEGEAIINTVKEWVAENGIAFFFDVLFAILLLLLGSVLIRVGENALRKTLSHSGKVSQLLEQFLCSVAVKTGWTLLIMIALQRVGVNIAPLIAGLGVTGFILGFAFQESLGNLAAGMMIAINEPFKIGDYVSMGGIEGSIQNLNMMAATLVTSDQKQVIVPNKVVWGSPITNFSAMDKRRLDIPVAIAYGTDIGKARSVALSAVQSLAGVLEAPLPSVDVVGLGETSVNLVIRLWSKNADYWAVLFAATQEVKEAFGRNGVGLPTSPVDVRTGQVIAACYETILRGQDA